MLTDDKHRHLRPPVGRTHALFGVMPHPRSKTQPPCRELVMLDIATCKSTKLEDVPPDAEIQGYCWSPDGKRLPTCAPNSRGKPEDLIEKETESHLASSATLMKESEDDCHREGKGQWHITLAGWIGDNCLNEPEASAPQAQPFAMLPAHCVSSAPRRQSHSPDAASADGPLQPPPPKMMLRLTTVTTRHTATSFTGRRMPRCLSHRAQPPGRSASV